MVDLAKIPTLSNAQHLNTGKKRRFHEILYNHGIGHGLCMLLPVDQGLEHGPMDFFPNPPSQDPDYVLDFALEGGYSGIVFHVGIAEKYWYKFAGKLPLVLKINGKTNIPPDDEAFSPCDATVEDAVRLGADAVGYTLYVGSPSQDVDFQQLNQVRIDCERFGMPLIVWSYPRGAACKAKGGNDSIYAVDYAARVALELGADMVKLNMPKIEKDKQQLYPKPYNTLDWDEQTMMNKVVNSAGRCFTLVSGGSKLTDEQLLSKVKISMEAGCTGLIFGRNMWQRERKEALEMTKKVKEIMIRYARD